MTRYAAIVLVGFVLCLWSSPRGTDGVPVAAATSVVDEIKNDKDVCQLANIFLNSKFVKPCERAQYPSSNVTLNQSDPTQILCLAFYDRTLRLCYLDSLRGTGTSVLPNQTEQFDIDVKKSMPTKQAEGIAQFCSKWDIKYPPRDSKIRSYIAQFNEDLKNPIMCLKICIDGAAEFNPMCSVLEAMDRLSNLTKQEKVEETQEDKPVVQTQEVQRQGNAAGPKVKAETTVGVEPEVQVDIQNSENLPVGLPDVSVKELTEETARTEANLEKQRQEVRQESSGGASAPTTKSKQPDAESKQLRDNSEAKANSEIPVAKLPEKNVDNDEHKGIAKSEKEQQTEKQTVEVAQKTTGSGLSNNVKTTDSVKPAVDAANAPQNQGTFGEDITDAVGSVLDDQKLGVISQHTQDEPEDQFGEGDPVEALGETDSEDYLDDFIKPPSPDEDVDQNSLQPSEKREYVPRMPNIPNEDDSHFFGYFTVFGVMCIAGYVGYHNKQKILAMVLEGRRSRGGRNRRRPSTANYRKLDCTLEEAVTSQCNSNVTHVIY